MTVVGYGKTEKPRAEEPKAATVSPTIDFPTISLHQTILAPKGGNIPPLFVLTFPKSEVTAVDAPLSEVVTDLLEFPAGAMTAQEWADMANFFDTNSAFNWRRLNGIMEENYRLRGTQEYQRFYKAVQDNRDPSHFARQAFLRILSPPTTVSPAARIFSELLYLARYDFGLPAEQVFTWSVITALLTEPPSEKAQAIAAHLMKFDIPYSLSPEADKETLEAMLTIGKATLSSKGAQAGVALLPVVRTAWEWPELAQKSPILAVEHMAAAGTTSIMIVGTMFLVDRILSRTRKS